MMIYVDADACAAKKEIVAIAEKYDVEVTMVMSICHLSMEDGYSKYLIVDNAAQSVDMAIANRVTHGDVVVTDDYGLASIVLMKKALCISNRGLIFSLENIEQLMFQRYMSQQIRRGGGKVKGPSKRSKEDELFFIKNLDKLIGKARYNPHV